MRKLFWPGCGLVAAALALSGVGEASAQTATVMHLEGKARASSDHVTWHKLANGSAISSGMLIQTAENTILDIALSGAVTGPSAPPVLDKQDAGLVRLMGNSVMAIDKLTLPHPGEPEDIELDLRVGELRGVAGKPDAGSKYEIKFDKGVVGVQGAEYSLTAGGILTVWAGQAIAAAVTTDASPQVKVVAEGHQYDSATGMLSEVSAAPPATIPGTSTSTAPPAAESPAPKNSPAPKPPTGLRPLRPF